MWAFPKARTGLTQSAPVGPARTYIRCLTDTHEEGYRGESRQCKMKRRF